MGLEHSSWTVREILKHEAFLWEGLKGQEEKGTTEDEIAGWHHRLDGHEFE